MHPRNLEKPLPTYRDSNVQDVLEPEELAVIVRQNKKRNIIASVTAAAVLSPIVIVVENIIPYTKDLLTMDQDDGSMVEDVAGCPPLPKIVRKQNGEPIVIKGFLSPQQLKQTVEVEDEFADKRSAAENFKPESFSPIEFAKQVSEIHKHEILNFTSEYSGIDFHLYSDEANPFENVDIELLDELLHATLSEDIEYKHVMVMQFMECIRKRIIDDRELQEQRINIYVPSRPGVCWSNGLIQDKPEEATYKDFCDSSGGSYYKVTAGTGPLRYERAWMTYMSHVADPEIAKRKLAEMTIHEINHLWMQFMGLPFKLRPNERLAEYLEDQTIQFMYEDGIPQPYTYRDDTK